MNANTVRCPHGYVCEYIYRTEVVDGVTHIVGGDFWHDPGRKTPRRKCDPSKQKRRMGPPKFVGGKHD